MGQMLPSSSDKPSTTLTLMSWTVKRSAGRLRCLKEVALQLMQLIRNAKNTAIFEATAVYSTFRRIGQGPRNFKIIVKSRKGDLGYNGVFDV